jgi:hypothetical protein
MKSTATFFVAVCGWTLITAVGQAQVPGAPRPAVSPYLQLNRPGESPALNYYGLVRPQLAANKTFLALGADINALDAQTAALQASQLVQTGHASGFMTQGRFFMNNGATRQGSPLGQPRPQTKVK